MNLYYKKEGWSYSFEENKKEQFKERCSYIVEIQVLSLKNLVSLKLTFGPYDTFRDLQAQNINFKV